MSRLNSSDIILTRYADEIEFLSNNIPFYKVRLIKFNPIKIDFKLNASFFRAAY